MSVVYVKRYRMTLSLEGRVIEAPQLPEGYRWERWSRELLARHAETKYLSFTDEFDSIIFPALGKLSGCLQLMQEISGKHTFVPEATWLLMYEGERRVECCGTIQGLSGSPKLGSIQNVGITPDHRGKGLGRMLVLKSVSGFRDFGFQAVFLEVTVDNERAVKLYEQLGFQITRTMYRMVEFRGRLTANGELKFKT